MKPDMVRIERLAVASPMIEVTHVAHNADAIIEMIEAAAQDEVALLALPALCLTGAACGDLFRQQALLVAAEAAVLQIAVATAGKEICAIFGVPLRNEKGQLQHCAVAVFNGTMLQQIGRAHV